MSGLIWVQTVCKDYQQTTLVRINEVLNSVNRDQTVPSGVVPSEFTLFSQFFCVNLHAND